MMGKMYKLYKLYQWEIHMRTVTIFVVLVAMLTSGCATSDKRRPSMAYKYRVINAEFDLAELNANTEIELAKIAGEVAKSHDQSVVRLKEIELQIVVETASRE